MPKLPKGMYRRGRVFYVRLQRGGKDVRRTLGSEYEEACRSLRALRREELTPLDAPRVLVRQALKRWLETAVATARIPSGRRDVGSRVERFIEPLLGMRQIATVRPDDVLAFRAELERRGLRVTLVHRILTDLRSFLRWAALEARLIREPPIPRRLLPRLQQSFPKRLSDDEVQRVAAIPEPYGFVCRLALGTGLRWGELTRAHSFHVQRGVLLVSQTKSGKTRKVPLPPGLLNELAGRQGRLVPFSHPGMFTRRVGNLSGMKDFHVHRLRHTFATRWAEAGGNLAVLQQILGHASILTTMRYSRPSDEAVKDEALRVAGQTGTVPGTGALEVGCTDAEKTKQQKKMTR